MTRPLLEDWNRYTPTKRVKGLKNGAPGIPFYTLKQDRTRPACFEKFSDCLGFAEIKRG